MSSASAIRLRSQMMVMVGVGTLSLTTAFFIECTTYSGEDGRNPSPGTPDADAAVPALDGGEDAALGVDATPPKTKCDPSTPFTTIAQVTELSAAMSGGESSARLTADGRTIYFNRNPSIAEDPTLFRISVATRATPSGPFSNPIAVGIFTPSGELDTNPSPSPDGTTIFFQRSSGGLMGDRNVVSTSQQSNGSFGPVTPVAGLSQPTSAERTPFLAPSDAALWITLHTNSDAGSNPRRIARSEKIGEGVYGTPSLIDLGTPDTAEDGDPVLSADGLRLYFSSTREVASPDFNIWMATRGSAVDPFGAPQSVLSLNTVEREHPSWVSADECEIYFFRTQQGGAYRIFHASR